VAREQLIELIVAEGFVTKGVARAAAAEADREERPLVAVLADRGIAEEALADALARTVGTVVIDFEGGTLDSDAVHLLPHHLALRHLAVIVARDPESESLRVAFADPLDDEAIRVVREHTGLALTPLVATVSGVRAALEREYSPPSTRVHRTTGRSAELAPESTRRVEARDPAAPPETTPGVRLDRFGEPAEEPPHSTSPVHRIEQEASMEQRHEALLLALVEAGVITRADYTAVLRRLLRRS